MYVSQNQFHLCEFSFSNEIHMSIVVYMFVNDSASFSAKQARIIWCFFRNGSVHEEGCEYGHRIEYGGKEFIVRCL